MTVSDGDLSRAVSHALRHEPWLYEVELDEEGWAPADQLVEALREKGGDWALIDRTSLERMIASATKRRHELDGDRIRAIYGHSLDGRIKKMPARPPALLFHGTGPETWRVISHEGLRPMRRQYVHLSVDIETARAVGLRKSATPVVLIVHATKAADSGVAFYEGNDLVWLAQNVPPRFIELARLGANELQRVTDSLSHGGFENTPRTDILDRMIGYRRFGSGGTRTKYIHDALDRVVEQREKIGSNEGWARNGGPHYPAIPRTDERFRQARR
jgi:putative RNA 2'-phosphotransferase